MKPSKTTTIIYWITTALVFLWEGVMVAFTTNTDMAKEGIAHLGYPNYFRIMLSVFKVVGALVLILPFFKGRYKEWAYAGMGIVFISATVSHCAVDGVNGMSLFPLIFLVILIVSYVTYHKIQAAKGVNRL